jgi:hypothetical protein
MISCWFPPRAQKKSMPICNEEVINKNGIREEGVNNYEEIT